MNREADGLLYACAMYPASPGDFLTHLPLAADAAPKCPDLFFFARPKPALE